MPDDLVQMPGSRESQETLRRVALFDYVLHIAGLLLSMGLLSVVALIVNYVKRDDARGTIYESHMNWMISTFWWTLFWLVVSFIPSLVLSVVSFGLLSFLFIVPGLWYLYRMIKGLLRLLDGRPAP
ncbi:DUF4870 family protein [Quisquiliibacterium transsilvanicum]|uniref:Putative membrane protein n=1 Tax=Quisquiliibacterium transsilvanicum TaxID=1549638 RepID=A0A7W8M7Z2_9BURK|nr:hypothetical protein [Quisquiliibacterium transsilvanicum]MBB5271496.1 putative membrane protein [Quisquiliibacterium transsilvanicum]